MSVSDWTADGSKGGGEVTVICHLPRCWEQERTFQRTGRHSQWPVLPFSFWHSWCYRCAWAMAIPNGVTAIFTQLLGNKLETTICCHIKGGLWNHSMSNKSFGTACGPHRHGSRLCRWGMERENEEKLENEENIMASHEESGK